MTVLLSLEEKKQMTLARAHNRDTIPYSSFAPPANGNKRSKTNAKKSRFRPNRNLMGTIYRSSVILRSFSVVGVVSNWAKRDANGFSRFSYSPHIV